MLGSQSCQTPFSGSKPIVIEQSYSPAPPWLSQTLPLRTADGSLELVYQSPAVPNLELAANQLQAKIAMHAKEQLTAYVESAFLAALPRPLPFADLDRRAFSQAITTAVGKSVDHGSVQLKDYYYRKTKTGNKPAVAEVFALVEIPRPAYNGLVAAIAATLRQSPSNTLRTLARTPLSGGSF